MTLLAGHSIQPMLAACPPTLAVCGTALAKDQPMPEFEVPSQDHDRELERRVTSFLETKHVPGLRHLSVKAHAGIVTVSGRVQTFYEKQLCNQCCRRVAGVRELINAVDVITAMPGAAVVA
jgi:osmotically-inducible protein OsmY